MKTTIHRRILVATVAMASLMLLCLSLGMAQQAPGEAKALRDYEALPKQVQAKTYEALPKQVQAETTGFSDYPAPAQGQFDFTERFDYYKALAPQVKATTDLLAKYAESKDEQERTQIAAALTKGVSEEFDTRQAARAGELVQLEEQLRRLRSMHELRAKEKDEIVRDRVRQLIRNSTGLGWGTDDMGGLSEPYPRSSK